MSVADLVHFLRCQGRYTFVVVILNLFQDPPPGDTYPTRSYALEGTQSPHIRTPFQQLRRP